MVNIVGTIVFYERVYDVISGLQEMVYVVVSIAAMLDWDGVVSALSIMVNIIEHKDNTVEIAIYVTDSLVIKEHSCSVMTGHVYINGHDAIKIGVFAVLVTVSVLMTMVKVEVVHVISIMDLDHVVVNVVVVIVIMDVVNVREVKNVI